MTIEDGIGWTWVSNQDKEALRELQSFQCTTDRPKSPGVERCDILSRGSSRSRVTFATEGAEGPRKEARGVYCSRGGAGSLWPPRTLK